jgi:hypothetical protein
MLICRESIFNGKSGLAGSKKPGFLKKPGFWAFGCHDDFQSAERLDNDNSKSQQTLRLKTSEPIISMPVPKRRHMNPTELSTFSHLIPHESHTRHSIRPQPNGVAPPGTCLLRIVCI